MTEWWEKEDRVSRAYSDWLLVETDQRSFLRLGLEFSRAGYARIWKEAGEEPWYDDGPEQLEVFEDRVDGLHEADFEWMHLAGVLREAVTGFEVYLEKAREEVLGHQGRPGEIAERSPRWGVLTQFFARLGAEVNDVQCAARPGTPRNAPDGSRTRDLRLERPTLFGPPKGPVDH